MCIRDSFCPEPSEMYHDPHAFVSIDTLSETLCGKTRPIHFKGCLLYTSLSDLCKDNAWIKYFSEVYKSREQKGKDGWIDFESEISLIIQTFNSVSRDIHETCLLYTSRCV